MVDGDRAVEEYGGHFGEFFMAFGCKICTLSCFGAALLNFRMTVEIVGETVGYDCSLRHYLDVRGYCFPDLWVKYRVMGAGEDDGVDRGIGFEQPVYILPDEVVGSWASGFVVFNERYPHGASVAGDCESGI